MVQDSNGQAGIYISKEMVKAGAEIICEADWEFRADAEIVAEEVYRVMARLSDHPAPVLDV